VLFTGNLMNPNADSFSVPVRYTSRDPSDRLGLTSTWFPVELRDIKGYDHSQHEPGELLAILARYNGAGAAAPGYDLVLLDKWFVEDSRAAR
jgi:hypothetical protein